MLLCVCVNRPYGERPPMLPGSPSLPFSFFHSQEPRMNRFYRQERHVQGFIWSGALMGVLCVVVALGGCTERREGTGTASHTTTAKSVPSSREEPVKVSSGELSILYMKNFVAADERFKGKRLRLTTEHRIPSSFHQDHEKRSYYVVSDIGDDSSIRVDIYFQFPAEVVATMDKETVYTLEGDFKESKDNSTYGQDGRKIILTNCKIVGKK